MSKEQIEFDINKTCEVILTKSGADILNGNEFKAKTYKSGDTYVNQLWIIMRNFGGQMTLGCIPPFEPRIKFEIDRVVEGGE